MGGGHPQRGASVQATLPNLRALSFAPERRNTGVPFSFTHAPESLASLTLLSVAVLQVIPNLVLYDRERSPPCSVCRSEFRPHSGRWWCELGGCHLSAECKQLPVRVTGLGRPPATLSLTWLWAGGLPSSPHRPGHGAECPHRFQSERCTLVPHIGVQGADLLCVLLKPV